MNNFQKRVKLYVRNLMRSIRNKPVDHISVGVDIKNCKDCRRNDCDTCPIRESLRRIRNLPNCHDCGSRDYCGFLPKWGQDVRFNCPLWTKENKKEETK